MCISYVFIYKYVWIKLKNWYIIVFLFEKKRFYMYRRKKYKIGRKLEVWIWLRFESLNDNWKVVY